MTAAAKRVLIVSPSPLPSGINLVVQRLIDAGQIVHCGPDMNGVMTAAAEDGPEGNFRTTLLHHRTEPHSLDDIRRWPPTWPVNFMAIEVFGADSRNWFASPAELADFLVEVEVQQDRPLGDGSGVLYDRHGLTFDRGSPWPTLPDTFRILDLNSNDEKGVLIEATNTEHALTLYCEEHSLEITESGMTGESPMVDIVHARHPLRARHQDGTTAILVAVIQTMQLTVA